MSFAPPTPKGMKVVYTDDGFCAGKDGKEMPLHEHLAEMHGIKIDDPYSIKWLGRKIDDLHDEQHRKGEGMKPPHVHRKYPSRFDDWWC